MPQMNSWYLKRITSHVSQGQSREALCLFHDLHKTGLRLTEFVLSPFLRACGRLGAIKEGRQAHNMTLKLGFNKDTVLMTCLLDMYSKCSGSIQEAYKVFAEMPERDVVTTNVMISGLFRFKLVSKAVELFDNMTERDEGSWNTMISGLAKNSKMSKAAALDFFQRMRVEGGEVDVITMTSVLSVCADLAMLVYGKQIHGLVFKHGLELCLEVGNATLDMYAKCGCMESAYLCFKHMPWKNVVSWTSLIHGYGKHGLGIEAVKAFDAMEREEKGNIVPNTITFLSALYACSHSGLVQEGWRIFNTMVCKYSMKPIMEHYTCMVDLLARAGRLSEAYDFIERMPVKPDEKLLTAFLSSCCSHMNVELARKVGDKLLQLEPQQPGAYMLLSNFYGLNGELINVANVRRMMLDKGVRKEKAYTWIEIDKQVHSFVSGDRSHPLSEKIYGYLQKLIEKMKKIGYVPNTSMVMQNVDEDTKEELVLGHSEKLAIALGLISTPTGTRIMIVKNLRVCTDCHVATALISKIEGREIVARDSSRFHYFRDGYCSCGNHW